MEKINALDTEVFYWINQHHCTVADYVLYVFTMHWMWAVVIAGLFVWTVVKDKKSWWPVLLGIALCFLLADRVSVMCFKDVFQRLRPCHALPDVRMIFGMGCGGQYGFISSHAANSFAIAMFFTLWCRKNVKIKALPYVAFAWAAITSYSRPYLGKHYPGDIVCGAAVGVLLGLLGYLIINYIYKRVSQKKQTKQQTS
ncbi:MAG: phosphatase PAP2 family protein [Bacteroidales bacterium]|nr:phosphatase PAP2 family protein [Bacteroidales bacterium]